MKKLQLLLCVVAVALLIYLCSRKEECNTDVPVVPVVVAPNASPDEVKEAKAIAEVKDAQNKAVVANEKVKEAVVKLQRVRERLYTPQN